MSRPALKKKSYAQFKKDLLKSSRKTVALYLDMDGVFCGFEQRILEIFPEFTKLQRKYHDELKSEDEKLVFKNMVQAIKSTPDFWSELPWEPGGKEVYTFIKKYKNWFESISFLTSPIKSDFRCIPGKQEWIMTNFKSISLDAFYADSKKWEYVGKQPGELQVLIDDRPKNIELWKDSGGIGILHDSKNFKSTIDSLKTLINI